jgi:hypothetical protein
VKLENWAIEKQKELWEFWNENELVQEAFPLGFEMTTSPIAEDPKVVIMGRNPGSGKEPPHPHMERFTKPDEPNFGFPKEHDYLPGNANYKVARAMRNFVFSEHENILDKTIETNRNFLRTNNRSELESGLQKLTDNLREEYQTLCVEIIKGFIEKGNPDLIVSFTGYGDNHTYPVEEMKELYDYDFDIENQYIIERKSSDKNGSIRTTEHRITHAHMDSIDFLGFTPHLNNPNIPSPIRDLTTSLIQERILNS